MRVVKLKSKHRRLKAVFFAAVVIGAFALYYYLRIAPVISTVVTETTRMKVSEAIDDMTEKQLYEVEYGDFVILDTDSDGNVTFVQMNSVAVNLFARRVTSLIRGEMEKFEEQGIAIPLGTITGVPLLSDIGPELTYNVLDLGVVDADFYSEFSSAGINQTLHRLYMKIIVNMRIVLPGYSLAFDNSSTVMICENIIAGDVPLGNIDIGGELLP
ncbi:MAG TPA: sporulation protein YunB [Candidatus Protoclostridium stercorigallinarum]|uniref:Sporulation protein YunB n=1 Tax=Candidatus Protoclostridium stercorigallinarum TaxID=2838741 RepID=A0A9D1Q1J7_9FIRM|nr:sporulation protein YunB [Candidatus Protoclostridium stercorigallinarum]